MPDRICAHCHKEIEGEVVIALGKNWHKHHFLCAACERPLKDVKYIEENGKPYCENDWNTLFKNSKLPKCAKCNQPIEGKATEALGKMWHKEHFVCAHCQKPFQGKEFYTEDGKPYCEADHKKLFQDKARHSGGGQDICAHCNKPITGTVTKALGKSWHKEHFMCATCKKPFDGGEFFVVDGKPYCELDQKRLSKSKGNQASGGNEICAHCNKPITDTVLMAMDKSWHEGCFLCTECKKPIEREHFKVHGGKPYCDKDYFSKFGKKCSGCGHVIEEGAFVTALEKDWHNQCFSCQKCRKPIDVQKGFTAEQGQAICLRCSK